MWQILIGELTCNLVYKGSILMVKHFKNYFTLFIAFIHSSSTWKIREKNFSHIISSQKKKKISHYFRKATCYFLQQIKTPHVLKRRGRTHSLKSKIFALQIVYLHTTLRKAYPY